MDIPLIAHVTRGSIGLIMGAVALSLTKGTNSHKQAGYAFVAAMIITATPGGVISYLKD